MNNLEKHNFDLENSMDTEYLNPRFKTNKITPEGKTKIDKILRGSSSCEDASFVDGKYMDHWGIDKKPNKNKIMHDSGSDDYSPEINIKGTHNEVLIPLHIIIYFHINFNILNWIFS